MSSNKRFAKIRTKNSIISFLAYCSLVNTNGCSCIPVKNYCFLDTKSDKTITINIIAEMKTERYQFQKSAWCNNLIIVIEKKRL